jgi:DNA-binding beta-propeller fold protein YncE
VECFDSTFLFHARPGADQPSDVAVGPAGDIFLVDGVNHRVIVMEPDGRPKLTFGKEGTGNGEFRRPLGIDISQGRVWIADTGNRRIQVFDGNGHFLHMFPVAARPGEKPADPVDVLALGLRQHVYVADNDNHNIKVYNHSGVFQFSFGKFGQGTGEFRYPATLAANEFNQIFVVDVLNTRVQKFDPFGNYLTFIGSWGVLPGNLFRPKGVAVDKKNRVFVSDSYMGLVQAFTDLGRFLGVVCQNGKKKELTTPVGLGFDEAGARLHVVEMRANRVSVIEIAK